MSKYLANKINNLYDENTIAGCLNRIYKMIEEKNKTLLSDKYILDESIDPVSYGFMKKQEIQFWTNAEITKFTFDREDYNKADKEVKRAIDIALSFFSSGDGLITSNLAYRFMLEAENSVEMGALSWQLLQEVIHAENYNLALRIIVVDEQKIMELRRLVDEKSCVREKALLVEDYMRANVDKRIRLIAFAAIEGIFFWSSFATLFWFRQQTNDQNKMPFEGLVESNIQISKDESLHRDYGVARYLKYSMEERLPQEDVHQIISEFVEIEKKFADEILPQSYKELIPGEIKKFVEYMADNLLRGLKYEPLYGHQKAPDSLPWMAMGSRDAKANFYEVQPLAYKEKPLNDNEESVFDNLDEIEF